MGDQAGRATKPEVICPKCGSTDLVRDEVDIGVGIQYGPYHCNGCGWGEDAEVDTSDILEADEEWFKNAKPNSHAAMKNYVGPEGKPCCHYETAPNQVACGYDLLRQHGHEQHAFVRTLSEVTCTSCRVVVEQETRALSL